MALASLLLAPFASAQPGFDPEVDFSVGDYPLSVVVEDFNRDGNPDLAVANEGTDDVSVLIGDGGGSFGMANSYAVGDYPTAAAAGDLDGNGILDLVVVNHSSSNISLLLGDGLGGFTAASHFAVGSGPRDLTVGDVDLDGNLDVVTANYTADSVGVLLGDGAGGFAPQSSHLVYDPWSVELGDLDRDGDLDLVVANTAISGSVSILRGDGAGNFEAPESAAVNAYPNSVGLGDFNRDGQLDLAVSDSYYTHSVSVLLNVHGNEAPVPTADDIVTLRDTEGGTTVYPNDPDPGDTHTFEVTTDPQDGAASVDSDGVVAYTPDPDHTGSDSLVVTVTDSSDNMAEVTIQVTVLDLDFGDASEPQYPTTLAADGARHGVDGVLFLGAGVDGDSDGQPTANADGDHIDGNDDEDGVVIVGVLVAGGFTNVNVSASQAGRLDAWVDFNRDGDWSDPDEDIFDDVDVLVGENNLVVTVPLTAVSGASVARFRLSSAGGLSFTGAALDGEVEDHTVTILGTSDFLIFADDFESGDTSAWSDTEY